ncbi:hypothetical protein GIS00_12045 [Nakamurella sp. YIM 132087]|uniref:Uncharacterized protein n=1 Tax=Nakamurella alba TaxID=2665158 RepID=A0A7K1FPC9_9ACTN|nr:hypothetical protein [Nakamurella alba]MTD14674.1 hypothetical protein [Nakamurella alba]
MTATLAVILWRLIARGLDTFHPGVIWTALFFGALVATATLAGQWWERRQRRRRPRGRR